MSSDLIDRITAAQDPDADLALLRKAIATESITGNETACAHILRDTFKAMGLATRTAEFAPGRKNVWASRSGRSDWPHLMFVGHTDTVHVRGWTEHWGDDPRQNPFGAKIVDDAVWGRGSCDLKGGLCAAIAALRLLQDLGQSLTGSVTIAGVGDEESGEPGSGVSAGVQDLVARINKGEIGRPDFVIYVEPTRLAICTAQIGFFIAEMTITGKSSYFGYPEQGIDALKAAHAVLEQLWHHDADLATGPVHDLLGRSSLLVTGMEGGGLIAVPGECRLSLIRKLRPGEDLDAAIAAFERVLFATETDDGITIQVSYPAGRDHPRGGSAIEIDPALDVVGMLQDSLRAFSPDGGKISGAPYWSETPFFVNALACPAVYCAPGNIAVAHTSEEHIAIDEYLAAIRSFAMFMARYCGMG